MIRPGVEDDVVVGGHADAVRARFDPVQADQRQPSLQTLKPGLALGMHLDLFQRLHVDPASVSIVRYTATRPYVLATNTHAGDLAWLAPPPRKRGRARSARSTDAVVGGGAGPSATA